LTAAATAAPEAAVATGAVRGIPTTLATETAAAAAARVGAGIAVSASPGTGSTSATRVADSRTAGR